MKTTMKLIAVALVASLLGACSSSMQMSRSSGHQGDDLYYNPKSTETVVASSQAQGQQTSSSLKLAELEKKYTDILANDSIGSIDSTIYNDPYVNPYERILADSYEDAYQRRLDARRDPYYGISSWSAYYSNDYWYASAYDPSFYNVMVVGASVWVEPRHVSAMFGWPYFGSRYYRPYYSFGFGFYSPYYVWSSPWNYSIYNHWSYGLFDPWSTYGVYNAGFYDGYIWGSSPRYNYGRRPGTGTVNYNRSAIAEASYTAGVNSTRRDLADKQPTYGTGSVRERERANPNNGDANLTKTQPGTIDGTVVSGNRRVTQPGTPIARPQDPDTKTRIAGDRGGKTATVKEPVRGKDNSIVTRPERGDVNHTRVSPVTTRTSNRSEERTHNPSYTRPNPGNANSFNVPTSRNYPASDGVRSGSRAGEGVTGATRSPRQPSSTYTPPPRSSSPAVGSPGSSRSHGSSVGSTGTRGSSSVGSTRSSGRSTSVGSSSSSGSSSSTGSSSTGSSSTSTRSR